MRQEGIPVTDNMLYTKTITICKQNEIDITEHSISRSWIKRFKNKHRLSLRSKTLQGQLDLGYNCPAVEQFIIEVKNKMIEMGVDRVWNADQTAINYENVPSNTIDEIGSKSIWIKSAGKEKERVSLLLLGSSKGDKKTPFVIFKSKPSKIAATAIFNYTNQQGFGANTWKEI